MSLISKVRALTSLWAEGKKQLANKKESSDKLDSTAITQIQTLMALTALPLEWVQLEDNFYTLELAKHVEGREGIALGEGALFIKQFKSGGCELYLAEAGFHNPQMIRVMHSLEDAQRLGNAIYEAMTDDP